MNRSLLALSSALVVLLVAPAAAHARLTATAKIVNSGAKVRVEVVLKSSTVLAPNRRPTALALRVGSKSYALRRATRAKGKNLGTWRSALYEGSTASTLVGLRGKRSTLIASARSGRTRISTTVAAAPPANQPGNGGSGGTTTPTNPFTGPASDLEGLAAFEHIKGYLFNSRFTDCVAYWPNCQPVNYSYIHCADFSWQYHRDTFTSGADIHSYDSFTVTGANAYTSGAWAISYTTGTGGNYVWNVTPAGVVTGQYQFGSNPVEALGPFQWARPGGTWNKPEGNCPA